jgi:hypothetical protein
VFYTIAFFVDLTVKMWQNTNSDEYEKGGGRDALWKTSSQTNNMSGRMLDGASFTLQ